MVALLSLGSEAPWEFKMLLVFTVDGYLFGLVWWLHNWIGHLSPTEWYLSREDKINRI